MNEVLKNIATRRSCRSFKPDKVEAEKVEKIITAGLYAPSAMNTQNWMLTVIDDEEKLEGLRAAIEIALDRPGYHRFYGASLFIIVTVPRDYRHGAVDSACVLENMFLAAHSIGVDSVWINQIRDCYDDENIRALLTSFGIPEDHICFGCGAFGYGDKPLPEDRENKGIVNFVK